MAAGAQEQSAQTTEVASAMEEITRTILETSKNTENVSLAANNANKVAEKGKVKVQDTKESIELIVQSAQKVDKIISSLVTQSEQIGEITQVIDDIADQTNLLALNAAIEAARAGEQGRGFAVVADEVRKLAEKTTKATKEIADKIKTVQLKSHTADEAMEEARTLVEKGMTNTIEVESVLHEINQYSSKVADLIGQIAAASEQQSATAEQISRNIESINNVTNENASGTQQVAHASEDLSRLTENLQQVIKKFKIIDYSKNEEYDHENNNQIKINESSTNLFIRNNGELVQSNIVEL